MSDIKKLLGKKIQLIRKSRQLTQEKLAELIGIETPSLSYLETGKYSPSVDTLQKLSDVLGVKPWEFYYFDETTHDEMRQELDKALSNNPKVVKIMYSILKSIEY